MRFQRLRVAKGIPSAATLEVKRPDGSIEEIRLIVPRVPDGRSVEGDVRILRHVGARVPQQVVIGNPSLVSEHRVRIVAPLDDARGRSLTATLVLTE